MVLAAENHRSGWGMEVVAGTFGRKAYLGLSCFNLVGKVLASQTAGSEFKAPAAM